MVEMREVRALIWKKRPRS